MKTRTGMANLKTELDSTSRTLRGVWRRVTVIALCATALFSPHAVYAQYDAKTDSGCKFRPAVTSNGGVISSISDEATQVGIDILDAGGNAMDAAVATVFALGVTRPDVAGVGGDGSLVYRSAMGDMAALDFRAPAPDSMTPRRFEDPGMHRHDNGLPHGCDPTIVDDDPTTNCVVLAPCGHLQVGIPTTVAAMAAALERYGSGKFTLGQLIRSGDPLHPRAYELARYGATVSPGLANDMFFGSFTTLPIYLETARTFLVGGVSPYPPGSKIIQLDLSNTLGLIADQGPSVFYTGEIADKIVADMRNAATDLDKDPAVNLAYYGGHSGDRGLITKDDLTNYRPLWVTPVVGTYRGHQIIGMAPPMAGGVFITEMLNILEGYPLNSNGAVLEGTPRDFRFGRTDYIHVLAEAEKLAWADHLAYVADPAFLDESQRDALKNIVTKGYAKARRQLINLDHADTSLVAAGAPGKHTNHLSVIDKCGNAVAVTTTQNYPFGSCVTVPGTGILLNNELDDFSAAGTINEPDSGKKSRSHQSPTIVVRNGRPALVTGGAGAGTIMMGVLQDILNVVDFNLALDEAADAKRIEARGFPYRLEGADDHHVDSQANDLFMEPGRFDQGVIDELVRRSHNVVRKNPYGDFIVGCDGSVNPPYYEYFGLPIVNTARFNVTTGKNEAVTDPRNGTFEPTELNVGENGAKGQQSVEGGAACGGDVCGKIDDADPALEYRGGWHRRTDARASNGSYTRRMGSHDGGNGSSPVVKLVFSGDELTYFYVQSDIGGTADISIDGQLKETLSYGTNRPGQENPTFGYSRKYSGLGPNSHTLVIEHRTGAVYVDGFGFACAQSAGADPQAATLHSVTETSTASAGEGPVIERKISVGVQDRELSVVVEGSSVPLTVNLIGPLGTPLASGQALVAGFSASGVDHAVSGEGVYRVQVVGAPGAFQSIEISTARTVGVSSGVNGPAPALRQGSEAQAPLPTRIALAQNQPNPFASTTSIRFALPAASPVKLELFDLLGRRVKVLAEGDFPAGYHQVAWDRRDGRGELIRSGVYTYRLTVGTYRENKKMVLVPR